MDTKEIDRRLAEFCGWVPVRAHWEKEGESAYQNDSHCHRQLPAYTANRDAAQEAVAKLSYPKRLMYAEILMHEVGRYPIGCIPDWNRDRDALVAVTQATALQICNALIKTLDDN